ncbi:MAG: hypothetical protein C5B58_14385 [Acidobacteria bacterium]|nr:MAG: hypothetical protein C5B58_14385 [Acidobacteriota bacterium]
MTDETQVRYGPYKIWRNPASRQDSIAYLGEYYPPAGRIFLVALDLLELGFGPGEYTLRAPEQRKFPTLVPKWQRLKVSR